MRTGRKVLKFSGRAFPPVHGGLDYEELRLLGLDPAEVADFSSNLNPFFPSSGFLKGACAGAGAYPDASYSELRRAIAAAHAISPDCVFAGNGVSEIVHLLCRLLSSVRCVLIPVPTFSEYERAAAICGARTVFCGTGGEENLRFNPDVIASAIKENSPDLVFLCNPNNPTGLYLSRPEVETVASAARNALLVLDESYVDFVKSPWDSTSLAASGNVVILRSVAKFYGLAGVRMGYALSSPEIVSALNNVRPPWNVNSVAEKAAISVFSLPLSVRSESRSRLFAARDFLIKRLERMGKRTLPTDTGFFLVRADGAKSVRNRLLKRGIAVRDCSSFGLSSHIRLSARPEKDSERLVKEWAEMEKIPLRSGNGTAPRLRKNREWRKGRFENEG